MPTLDQALSALLEDLENRGLLDETLVVALGEMGRTAKPTPDWGRGHWSTLFPAVVAGAGVRGGIVYGASDKDGQLPIDNKTSPEDLAATIYEAMGIDPEMTIHMPDGRPIQLVSEGTPVRSIFG
jgi:arylsulfatase A-like enzyme